MIINVIQGTDSMVLCGKGGSANSEFQPALGQITHTDSTSLPSSDVTEIMSLK